MKYSRKADAFDNIFGIIAIFILTFASLFTFVGFIALCTQSIMEDPKIQKIYNIESVYKDDYTKAITLDEAEIYLGEDIVVKVETKNYELTTTYDANGNYIESDVDAKIPGVAILAAFALFIWVDVILYFIGKIIYTPIKKKLEAVDKKKNDELKKLEELDFEENIGEL